MLLMGFGPKCLLAPQFQDGHVSVSAPLSDQAGCGIATSSGCLLLATGVELVDKMRPSRQQNDDQRINDGRRSGTCYAPGATSEKATY